MSRPPFLSSRSVRHSVNDFLPPFSFLPFPPSIFGSLTRKRGEKRMKNLLFLRLNHRKKNLFGKNGRARTVPDYNKDAVALMTKKGKSCGNVFPPIQYLCLSNGEWQDGGMEVLLALHGESRVWKGKKSYNLFMMIPSSPHFCPPPRQGKTRMRNEPPFNKDTEYVTKTGENFFF